MDNFKESVKSKGFCRIKNVFSEKDLDHCESIITSKIEADNFYLAFFKAGMTENPDRVERQIELSRPSVLSVELRKSPVFRLCHLIAKEYFGGTAYYWYDHAIFKMPNSSIVTHWHQDQAYLSEKIIIPSLHFWIPFQDTYAGNGAMQFVEGSHNNFFPHTLAYPGKSHILKVVNAPDAKIHCMGINRGDVSLHTNLTLHSAGVNKSEQTRKAWIIHFGQKPAWYKRILQLKLMCG